MNRILVIGLVSLMILFAGCSADTGDAQTSGFLGSGSSSKGGVGVGLSFAEGNPKSEMIKEQPGTFAFVFTNYQEHEISDLVVRSKGFDWNYVNGLDEEFSIDTIPKATTQTGPGIYAGYIVSGVSVSGFTGDYNFNPKFDYCYSAKTLYREQICVPSVNNQCDTDVTKSLVQNGPLSVKYDRINSIEDEIRIDFTVNDNGGGKVVNECFNDEDYANSYELVATLGSDQGSCEAVSGQNMINGKSKFYCTFSRSGDDSYASQIVVELDYKYQQTKEQKITVKDLNQGYN
ncbi:MAG: hypothetical protein PF569_06185 [Candidatus Woesearchaeota archaeon]|jgi:hypothetical protein|nr:hypothetical protein [Candidatus Woesearchaeota archaeon]